MLAFIDYLIQWLMDNVTTTQNLTWIFGDPGASELMNLPAGYVVPLFDTIEPLSNQVDTDTYAIPILVVDDVAAYGPPIANVNAPGAFEQPGYRNLMTYGEAIRDALRNGGASITFNGIVATSQVPAINYVFINIDGKNYRGVRVALQVIQRRHRES